MQSARWDMKADGLTSINIRVPIYLTKLPSTSKVFVILFESNRC